MQVLTSRSNWAKDNSTLSVSRPIELVVLNCVTETNDTASIEELDEPGKIGERSGKPVDLVDDDDVDPAAADIGKQALQRRPLQIAAGNPPSS